MLYIINLDLPTFATLGVSDFASMQVNLPAPQPWKPTIPPFSNIPTFSAFQYLTNGSTHPIVLRAGHFGDTQRVNGPIKIQFASCYVSSQIRYTTNGSMPTVTSALYAAPLTFSTNATSSILTQIRAACFDLIDTRRSSNPVDLEFNIVSKSH